jgi:hypothetical protein
MSLPRELVVGPDGSLGMAPVAELLSLRGKPFVPARRAVGGGGPLLEADRSVAALEVEVAEGGPGATVVDLLDEHGGLVVEIAVAEDEIEISLSTVVPATTAALYRGPLRIFYDDGICEVFTAAGQVRTEIFYDRALVRLVAVREVSNGGGLSPVGPEKVRAWELANIWEGR